jgi:hypothetical protein
VPHSTDLLLAFALALAIGPLAYAAAINPSFRVAPVTAVLVLMISTKLGEAPIGLAYDRAERAADAAALELKVHLIDRRNFWRCYQGSWRQRQKPSLVHCAPAAAQDLVAGQMDIMFESPTITWSVAPTPDASGDDAPRNEGPPTGGPSRVCWGTAVGEQLARA